MRNLGFANSIRPFFAGMRHTLELANATSKSPNPRPCTYPYAVGSICHFSNTIRVSQSQSYRREGQCHRHWR